MTSTAPGEGVMDRIWIMAPIGPSTTMVKITAPINSSFPLEISGEGLEFDGADTKLLTGPETEIAIKAANSVPPGTEIALKLKLKNGSEAVEAVSLPVAAKAMKQRKIRVRVWRVKADNGDLPAFNPTQAQLEEYLNDVFKPQINVTFDCSVSEVIGPIGWDTATGTTFGGPEGALASGNGYMNFGTDFKQEMANIRSGHYVSSFNINLYFVGGVSALQGMGSWNSEKGKFPTILAAGISVYSRRESWIAAGLDKPLIEGLDTIAHELGHVIFGDGHPDQGGGKAILEGTPYPTRLMASGPDMRNKDGTSRLIVKQEWDEAKKWLDEEIGAGRMAQ